MWGRNTGRIRGRSRKQTGNILLVGTALALILTVPSSLRAQSGEGWIGKRVVQKYAVLQLRGPNGTSQLDAIYIYRVEQVDGSMLTLQR